MNHSESPSAGNLASQRQVLLVGASVRAAAQSARLAGFQPFAVDHFADQDLLPLAPVQLVENYPWEAVDAARRHPAAPWMYTGALENHPRIIEAIARERLLLGNSAGVVRRLRDPWELERSFRRWGLSIPAACRFSERPQCGDWMCKPLRSAGGSHIARYRVEVETDLPPAPDTHFWQQFIPGESISAIFVGAQCRATLCGITRQLIGCSWANAAGFKYTGSVGPLSLPDRDMALLRQIGKCLVEEFELTGLFGVDAIRTAESIWTVEVNPRYTASIEILERALPFRSIALHDAACQEGICPVMSSDRADLIHGKSIYYAKRVGHIPARFAEWVDIENSGGPFPKVADIPAVGTVIQPSHPVCTLFASGEQVDVVVAQLRDQSCALREVLSDG